MTACERAEKVLALGEELTLDSAMAIFSKENLSLASSQARVACAVTLASLLSIARALLKGSGDSPESYSLAGWVERAEAVVTVASQGTLDAKLPVSERVSDEIWTQTVPMISEVPTVAAAALSTEPGNSNAGELDADDLSGLDHLSLNASRVERCLVHQPG